jgi:hypothetical protein
MNRQAAKRSLTTAAACALVLLGARNARSQVPGPRAAPAQAAPVAPVAPAAPPAPAMTPEQIDAADEYVRQLIRREPRAHEVIEVALRHYRVHATEIDALRASSRYRGLLPVFSTIGSVNRSGSASASSQTISNPQDTVSNQAYNGYAVSLGLSWDLRELMFNPSELQAYGLVGIQQDILLEVTRAYFMRRQLQIRLAIRPPSDVLTKAILELRVDEYAAILDAMTGGWFGRSLEEREKHTANGK